MGAKGQSPRLTSHLDLGRFSMFQWKVRLAVAAALALSAVGGDFDWLWHFGW